MGAIMMMNEKRVKALIQEGRQFMHCQSLEDQDEFISDQQLKKPQPPLIKAAMRTQQIKLPRNFEALTKIEDFTEILSRRHSSRVFTQKPISLLQLSYLLWASQGVKEIRGKQYATLRTVPSGGARHGFETYLIVKKCEGLKSGAYHYLPMEHALEFLHEVVNDEKIISDSVCGQIWAGKASVVFYWSLIAYRCEWRYGIRAHRVALIDVGHVGQNLYLACAALNLGACGIAAFDDAICSKLFELDVNEEFVVYTAPVGTVNSDDIEKEKEFYRFVEEEGL